jgi:hypothetical protein
VQGDHGAVQPAGQRLWRGRRRTQHGGLSPGLGHAAAEARAGLDKVAKALNERPALKMTVVGTASLERSARPTSASACDALLQAEKRRAMLAGNASAAGRPAPR